jgi:hypothetical protein
VSPSSGPWSFDPVRLGGHECDALVGYYWRDWRLVLRAASLAALYVYVYERPAPAMTPAARDRALAMRVSDAWVAAGCDVTDPRVAEERALLVLLVHVAARCGASVSG